MVIVCENVIQGESGSSSVLVTSGEAGPREPPRHPPSALALSACLLRLSVTATALAPVCHPTAHVA